MDIGTLGEDTFKTLCSSVGLISTPPSKDENGWDAYIEFPLIKQDNSTLDKQEVPVRCKVQVKATHGMKQRKLSIKLSAMHKLAIEHMPTFVCFMHFDNIHLKEIYLVHLDDKLIGRILKRIRQAEAKGTKINHQTITVQYTTNHRLKEATGQLLKDEILKYSGNSIEKYIQNKQKMLKTLGYEDTTSEIKMSVPLLKRKESINRFLINQEEVDVTINSFLEKRFDIAMPIKDMPLGEATISLKQPEQKFKLHIRKHKFDKPIILDIKSRSHPFVQNAIMFYNDILKMVFDYYDENKLPECKMGIEYTKEYEFGFLLQHLKYFHFIDNNLNIDIQVEFHPVNRMFTPFTLKSQTNKRSSISNDIYETFFMYENLFAKLQIDSNTKVNVENMMALSEQANVFYYFLNNINIPAFKLSMNLTEPKSSLTVNEFIVLTPIYFTFNNVVYILISEIKTHLEITEDQLAIATGINQTILHQFEVSIDNYEEQEIHKLMQNRVVEEEYNDYLINLGSNSSLNLAYIN